MSYLFYLSMLRIVVSTYWLYIWVTSRVPHKRKELLTLREHLSSPLLFWWGSMLLIFLVSVLSYYVSLRLSSVLWYPLRCPHKKNVRFVFTSSCLLKGSCLIYVICVCLCIVVYNTYCVVFLFCLSCVPYVASFSGLSIFFIAPFDIF